MSRGGAPVQLVPVFEELDPEEPRGEVAIARRAPNPEPGRRPRLSSERSALIEALVATEGHIARAARLIGMNEKSARSIVHRDPEVRRAAERARKLAAERAAESLRPWIELAPRAQQALEEALSAEKVVLGPGGVPVSLGPDHRMRVQAAEAIFDRTFGKPVARVEGELTHRETPLLDATTAHRAMAVSLVKGWPAVQAVEWVREHPEEAERILTAFRALAASGTPTGGENGQEGP